MNRDERLAWCKERALEYVDAGRLNDAVASMMSDLEQHQELKEHPGKALGMQMLMMGMLSNPGQVRRWVVGFH